MKGSITYLNLTQFLDALNENMFKYIVAFFLIHLQGNESASEVMSITGAVFILPFITLSSLGGVFADLYSKTTTIRVTRILQFVFMIVALFMVIYPVGNWIYVILFIIAALSAVFSPSKYGIIPELVSHHKIVVANAFVAAFTYWGIILGTGFASVLATLTNESFPWMVFACVVIAIFGVIFSYKIPPTAIASPQKKWPKFIYKEIPDAIKEMRTIPLMVTAVFCYSYFLFMGAYVQMNIVPYAIAELGMGAVAGGYLFLFSSVGVGIGALIASKLSGSLKYLHLYGVGMSLVCFLFTLIPNPYWINIVWLVLIGIFAGLFLVPPQAFIVVNSVHENKGRNIGTANFFSFIAALIAAVVLYILNTALGISPAWSFTWVGVFNLLVSFFIFLKVRKNA